jgi:urease accessory protein
MSADWLLWQLADSAFPSGGFAHSGGLEAAWQHGSITTPTHLREFLDAQLRNIAHAVAPFMMAARADDSAWISVDQTCDIFLSNHVANRASRAQGGAFIAAAERVFHLETLTLMRARIRAQRLPGHFAPIFGAATLALNIDPTAACKLLLFLTARSAISSAVRLGIVGPLEAQSIQHDSGPRIDHWTDVAQQIDIDDVAQTSPLLDLLQSTQDRLYSRLFQS